MPTIRFDLEAYADEQARCEAREKSEQKFLNQLLLYAEQLGIARINCLDCGTAHRRNDTIRTQRRIVCEFLEYARVCILHRAPAAAYGLSSNSSYATNAVVLLCALKATGTRLMRDADHENYNDAARLVAAT